MKLKKIIKLIRKGKICIYYDNDFSARAIYTYFFDKGYTDIEDVSSWIKESHSSGFLIVRKKSKNVYINASSLWEMIVKEGSDIAIELPEGWSIDQLLPANDLLELVQEKRVLEEFAEIALHLGFEHEFEVVIDSAGVQVLIARDV